MEICFFSPSKLDRSTFRSWSFPLKMVGSTVSPGCVLLLSLSSVPNLNSMLSSPFSCGDLGLVVTRVACSSPLFMIWQCLHIEAGRWSLVKLYRRLSCFPTFNPGFWRILNVLLWGQIFCLLLRRGGDIWLFFISLLVSCFTWSWNWRFWIFGLYNFWNTSP